MFQVTAKTDYGLLLMIALGKANGRGQKSLRQLADEQRLPYRFLTQIAIPLRHAGLLEAKEGVGGGYRLTRPPDAITVGEIVRALEGPIGLVRCAAQGAGTCPSEGVCALPPFWHKVGTTINRAFDTLTLADLLASPVTAPLHAAAARA